MNRLNKLVDLLKKNINDNFFIILGLGILNYLNYGIYRSFYNKYSNYSLLFKSLKFILGFVEVFLFIMGIFYLLYFLKEKIRKIILKIFIGVSLLFFSLDFILLKTFKTIINNTTIQILLETNKNESIEFIEQYINFYNIIMLIFIICIICIILSLKCKIKIKSKKILMIVLILLLVQFLRVKKVLKVFPEYRLYTGISFALENEKIYKDLINKLENNVVILENKSQIKNIVLIIGESTRKKNMGLYGYNLDTTPNLNKIKQAGNLFVYNDVISPHAQTISSLKKILTFKNNTNSKEWYQYNNLIDVMKKSDYNTFWLSNQESSGIFANVAVAFGSRSDTLVFNRLRASGDEESDAYDEEIVEKSKKIINEKNKNFIIFHLLGTHSSYRNRYPKKFEEFKLDNYRFVKDTLNKRQIEILSFYDNAVLYNDYVVSNIINEFKDTDSIVIYFSDHAEELYDRGDFYGHGEDNLSKYTVEIPFMIYVSDKFKEKHPKKVEQIKNAINRPYMTDDVIHTILDLSDIKTTEFDETKSVINDKFENKERIIGGKSYEGYWKNLN